MIRFKILIALSVPIILIFGFNSISDRSNVFSDVDAYCCDLGLCENTNPANLPRCTSPSSMIVKSLCRDISGTCKDCVDYTVGNCICNGGGSDFCVKSDGTIYYGVPRACDIDK